MKTEKELQLGVQNFKDALRHEMSASTREDLVSVEETYWMAYKLLKDSPGKEHRLICARCLESVARILDTEGRAGAGDDLRKQAEAFRKQAGPDTPKIL